MDIDETSPHLHRHNFIHPDLLKLADMSMDPNHLLTGTAAKIMKAPAPAMNLKVMNTAIWVLPASNAPEMIANRAPFAYSQRQPPMMVGTKDVQLQSPISVHIYLRLAEGEECR
jgi:hypothetical protein